MQNNLYAVTVQDATKTSRTINVIAADVAAAIGKISLNEGETVIEVKLSELEVVS